MENMDILCLTETWLTDDITKERLFLKDFMIHHIDRKTDNHKTKHGGVLIAVRKAYLMKRVELKNTDDYVVVKIEPKTQLTYYAVVTTHQKQARIGGLKRQ